MMSDRHHWLLVAREHLIIVGHLEKERTLMSRVTSISHLWRRHVCLSVYSIVISRHLFLLYATCMYRSLRLDGKRRCSSFRSLSCRRTELNCGNKENERSRERDDFVHPVSSPLRCTMKRTSVYARTRERERKGKKDEPKSTGARPTRREERRPMTVVIARRK